ncbi:heme biosynthesis protein HemY [Aureimonas populi]|uniref:Heme biosynthesis protein HemY n=1 Tax=Aureimonas populi TaxID=1701758 RepID=A0ABW5CGT5_9HYPH|nr:heme biosynthesis HemY N-terminal domain-containing protein [Aureimonas populi]
MFRILAFLLVVLILGLGFAWVADNPGDVTIAWLGREVETSFLTFLIAALLVVGAAILLFWLVSSLFSAPERIGGYFSARRRDKGYRALSGGILAAGAGDAATARRMLRKSERALDGRKEPLLRFLDAQTAMIEGDHGRARRLFEAMEKDEDTRLLALRGLFLEAERVNDPVAARHYAERAVRIAPHVPWAGGAVLELKAAEGDYDAALDILKAQRSSHLVDRQESNRLRAVLLTAKAQTQAETDPANARTAAREAQKLAPDLTPAALVAAKASIRLGDTRRASRILEKAWSEAPHPEVAELYVHAKPGLPAAERLQRAQRLLSLQPQSAESHLAVAHAALEARDLVLARREAEAAAAGDPRESVFLLLADIEDADTGDQGRVRAWMARALSAPRDPAWMAEGVVSPQWSPVSPVSGRLDAFKWSAPAERPAPARSIGGERAEPPAPPAVAAEPDPAPEEERPALTLSAGEAEPASSSSATEAVGEEERRQARFA